MSRFALHTDHTAPAVNGETVVPHASNNLVKGVCRSLYVGTGGDVAVVFGDDSVQVFAAVPNGAILPVEAKRVNATGTTATGMVAMY